MPTSDTKIQDAFRKVYGGMIDDRPPAPEWEEISTPTIRTTTVGGPNRRAGWLAAGAAAALVLVVMGGTLWLLGRGSGETGVGPGTESPTTTLPAAVARMTVVFAPGEITETEWDAFILVLQHFPSATGYFFADQPTAHEQALSLFTDDAAALDVLQEYPDIASSYAQVDFAVADDAFAFQEEVTSLEFVVTAVGSNGPRLGRGYGTSPDLSIGDDNVRARFWQYAYRSNLPPQLAQDPEGTATTTVQYSTDAQSTVFSGHIVAGDLPEGFSLADESGLHTEGDGLETSLNTYTRGNGPDDEEWAIIRVRWLPGLTLDVDEWVAARPDTAQATTVRGIPAALEMASSDDSKNLRFPTRGGVVLISGTGAVTIDDLELVAENIRFLEDG